MRLLAGDFRGEVEASRARMALVENHLPGQHSQKDHAGDGGGGSGDSGWDEIDQFGNAQFAGQWYNDQDISTSARLSPEYLDQFGKPAHETAVAEGFSLVLSERGKFHIAADRMDKASRPGLAKSDQGLGTIREPSDVVASGISRDGLASLTADVRSAGQMDAPDSSRVNAATGITVTSRNGGEDVSLSLNGKNLGYPDPAEMDVSIEAYDSGAHLSARNRATAVLNHPGHDQKSHAGGRGRGDALASFTNGDLAVEVYRNERGWPTNVGIHDVSDGHGNAGDTNFILDQEEAGHLASGVESILPAAEAGPSTTPAPGSGVVEIQGGAIGGGYEFVAFHDTDGDMFSEGENFVAIGEGSVAAGTLDRGGVVSMSLGEARWMVGALRDATSAVDRLLREMDDE